MTETEFRVKYSELIEYYQLIEMRLKGLCSVLFENEITEWYKRLNEYDTDPFGIMLKELEDTQVKKQKAVLSEEDFKELNEVRLRRNYWVHQCFSNNEHVTFRKGEVRKPEYAETIINDLDMAMEWDKKLADVFCANSKGMDLQSVFDELSKCFDFEIASIKYYPKRQ